MHNLSQELLVLLKQEAHDLVLDFVATTAAKVHKLLVALHRVDGDAKFIRLKSFPLDFHVGLGLNLRHSFVKDK